eukprot:UN33682
MKDELTVENDNLKSEKFKLLDEIDEISLSQKTRDDEIKRLKNTLSETSLKYSQAVYGKEDVFCYTRNRSW